MPGLRAQSLRQRLVIVARPAANAHTAVFLCIKHHCLTANSPCLRLLRLNQFYGHPSCNVRSWRPAQHMSVCQNFLFMARSWMVWGVLSLYKDSVKCFCEVLLCSCDSKKTIRLTDPTRSLPRPLLLFTVFYCPLLPFTCTLLPFTALYCPSLTWTALYCPLLPFTA